MDAHEQLQEWDDNGELDEEYAELQRILRSAKATRKQILKCFESMTGAAIVMVSGETEEETLRFLKEKLHTWLSHEKIMIQNWRDLLRFEEMPPEAQYHTLKRNVRDALDEE